MADSIPGVILAAGRSRRMGRAKALLPVDASGETFVARIVRTLLHAGIDPIIVVTRAELAADVSRVVPHVRVVINPDPDCGQLSSLITGLDALPQGTPVLMTLVDLPLVRETTVRALIGRVPELAQPRGPATPLEHMGTPGHAIETLGRASERTLLVRPVSGGRHGHPVILGTDVITALRNADPDQGARPVIRQFATWGIDVAVEDDAIHRDVDTPDEYRRLMP